MITHVIRLTNELVLTLDEGLIASGLTGQKLGGDVLGKSIFDKYPGIQMVDFPFVIY